MTLLTFWSTLLSIWTVALLAVSLLFRHLVKDFESDRRALYKAIEQELHRNSRERL